MKFISDMLNDLLMARTLNPIPVSCIFPICLVSLYSKDIKSISSGSEENIGFTSSRIRKNYIFF